MNDALLRFLEEYLRIDGNIDKLKRMMSTSSDDEDFKKNLSSEIKNKQK